MQIELPKKIARELDKSAIDNQERPEITKEDLLSFTGDRAETARERKILSLIIAIGGLATTAFGAYMIHKTGIDSSVKLGPKFGVLEDQHPTLPYLAASWTAGMGGAISAGVNGAAETTYRTISNEVRTSPDF